jgi:8-oxo-dGTP diphosphatase
MKVAKPTDWKIEALTAKRTTILLDRTFSPEDMNLIRRGFVPEQMEDKWFIYWKDNTLFFYRSWTGFCIYMVRFTIENKSCRMIEADVNRDSKQYQETSNERDAKMISYLIDVLLLRQDAVFPSDEPSSEKQAVTMWSQIGRAMQDQHPKQNND